MNPPNTPEPGGEQRSSDRPLTPLHAQLIRLHERLLKQMVSVRDELGAPSTRWLLREIRAQIGEQSTQGIQAIMEGLEEAVRAVKVSESQARAALLGSSDVQLSGIEPDLPRTLARYVADRRNLPGFTYTVDRDLVRGWVIHWKDFNQNGTVRGAGRYYERPYALIEDR